MDCDLGKEPYQYYDPSDECSISPVAYLGENPSNELKHEYKIDYRDGGCFQSDEMDVHQCNNGCGPNERARVVAKSQRRRREPAGQSVSDREKMHYIHRLNDTHDNGCVGMNDTESFKYEPFPDICKRGLDRPNGHIPLTDEEMREFINTFTYRSAILFDASMLYESRYEEDLTSLDSASN